MPGIYKLFLKFLNEPNKKAKTGRNACAPCRFSFLIALLLEEGGVFYNAKVS
jgi:hypothetical protein